MAYSTIIMDDITTAHKYEILYTSTNLVAQMPLMPSLDKLSLVPSCKNGCVVCHMYISLN